MSFPINPTNGQQTTVNGTLYTYNSTLTAWTVTSGGNQAINIAGNIQTASNVLASGIMSASGNIITDGYFVGNFAGNITGNLTVPGSNTQVLFNANGNASAVAGFTYNSDSNTMTVLGVVSSQGNVTGGNILTAGLISATGNITGGNILGGANVNATTHTGTTVSVTGNVTGNYFIGNGSQLTSVNASTVDVTDTNGLTTVYYPTFVENRTTGQITRADTDLSYRTDTNTLTVGNISATNYTGTTVSVTGNVTGTYFIGTATSAQYADIAENYTSDNNYEPGTVLEFGGSAEVTLATDETPRVAGVVSTLPAHLMNSMLTGEHTVAVALLGRVPCKVQGPVAKGDMLISAGGGYACAKQNPIMGTVIGKALEAWPGNYGVIEVVVGRL